ncbi:MAG: hypothetical protein C0485_07085 [Pirellula sp.]|nr:hypothetical protein [Pirellula sp.]
MLNFRIFHGFLRDGAFALLLNEMELMLLFEYVVAAPARRGYPQLLGRRFVQTQSSFRSSKTGASTEQNGRGRLESAHSDDVTLPGEDCSSVHGSAR